MFKVPEQYRITTGRLATSAAQGNNGFFEVPYQTPAGVKTLRVIASDRAGWEHVSVSLRDRVPSWEMMCLVKSLFWSADSCVVQYHPPESDYVNCHPYTLHLWRPIGVNIPRPPSILV